MTEEPSAGASGHDGFRTVLQNRFYQLQLVLCLLVIFLQLRFASFCGTKTEVINNTLHYYTSTIPQCR